MKFAVFAILVNSAAAFTPPSMTFAVGKKAPVKPVAKTVAVAPKKVAAPVKKVVAPTKAVAKPVAKVVAKPAPKVVAKPAPKVVAKAAPKVVAKAAPKVVAKPAPKVVAKPAPKVVAKAAPVKPAPKPVVKKVAPKPVVKKVVAKAAPPPVKKITVTRRSVGTIPSAAIPYELAPAALDGSFVGDVGFDPCFLSSKADTMVSYFTGVLGGTGPTDGLSWYREAELMHGRICMIAVVGFIAPGFGTFPGNEWTDSFGYTNPLEAFNKVPSASLFQIFAFMSILEFRRISFIRADGANYIPGSSQKWGQGGSDYWNPLGLNYTPAEYAEKQLQEIKHARLAMIGFLGLVFQANASGVGVVEQLSGSFVTPDYVAKAGYFLPEGI